MAGKLRLVEFYLLLEVITTKYVKDTKYRFLSAHIGWEAASGFNRASILGICPFPAVFLAFLAIGGPLSIRRYNSLQGGVKVRHRLFFNKSVTHFPLRDTSSLDGPRVSFDREFVVSF